MLCVAAGSLGPLHPIEGSSLCTHLYHLLEKRADNAGWECYVQIELPQSQITLRSPFQIAPHCTCSNTDERPPTYYVTINYRCWEMLGQQPLSQPDPPPLSILPLDHIQLIPIRSTASCIKVARLTSSRDRSTSLPALTTRRLRAHLVGACVTANTGVILQGDMPEYLHILQVEPSGNSLLQIDSSTTMIVEENSSTLQNNSFNEEFDSKSSGPKQRVLGSRSEVEYLSNIFQIVSEWKSSFPGSLFTPPGGLLLKSSSSSDCEQLVHRLATDHHAHFLSFQASDAGALYVGESEENLRSLFMRAQVPQRKFPLSVIYLDMIERICGKRGELSTVHSNRLVGQLLTLMDGINLQKSDLLEGEDAAPVLVVASTEDPKQIDEALRRSGRFDYELWLGADLQGVAAVKQRAHILNEFFTRVPIHSTLQQTLPSVVDMLAEQTKGFGFDDLESLLKEAVCSGLAEMNPSSGGMALTQSHLEDALHRIRPSRTGGLVKGGSSKPVLWSDIGGLEETKHLLQRVIEWPLRHAEQFARFNVPTPKGILLYGPPGCCKTTLVRAAAHSSRASFLSLNGAEIYSPYFGASENIIRETFKQARAIQPCLLFIDEIEAVVGKRDERDGSNGVQQRILSTLLNELDGVGTVDGQTEGTHVILICATNRPDMIDSALLRPGRLDQLVYVPKPNLEERLAIIQVKTNRLPIAADIDLWRLAELTEHFTGADIENLCREAALLSLQENIQATHIEWKHFIDVLDQLQLSSSLSGSAATDDATYRSFLNAS